MRVYAKPIEEIIRANGVGPILKLTAIAASIMPGAVTHEEVAEMLREPPDRIHRRLRRLAGFGLVRVIK